MTMETLKIEHFENQKTIANVDHLPKLFILVEERVIGEEVHISLESVEPREEYSEYEFLGHRGIFPYVKKIKS